MDSMNTFRARVAALKQQTEHWPHHPLVLASRQMPRLPARLCGLLALGLVVGWLTPAAGQAISCGATLGPGGVFTLAADLDCGAISPALTVRDGAHLDLGGRTISGGTGGVVLLVEGQRAVVHHGIVQNSFSGGEGILVAGEGGHTVRHVRVDAGGSGVVVTSDHNRLLNNTVTGENINPFDIRGSQNLLHSNWGDGGGCCFNIVGNQNLLVENTCGSKPGSVSFVGFCTFGNQNLLVGNNATETLEEGFTVQGDGNRLVGNLALNSGRFAGIAVSGQDTVLVGNTALDHGTDLLDTHEDCDNNRWQQNVFRTSRAGATSNPACIQ